MASQTDGRVRSIRIVRSGEDLPLDVLDDLAAGLARALRISCHVVPDPIDVGFALDDRRGQFYSTAILKRLAEAALPPDARQLAIVTGDLFVPVLTFVFGEAQLGGSAAVVSIQRLREEFYGLPPNRKLLIERLRIESLHELGHTFGLRHCDDWNCAMASSHSVELLDLKGSYCAECRARALLRFG